MVKGEFPKMVPFRDNRHARGSKIKVGQRPVILPTIYILLDFSYEQVEEA